MIETLEPRRVLAAPTINGGQATNMTESTECFPYASNSVNDVSDFVLTVGANDTDGDLASITLTGAGNLDIDGDGNLPFRMPAGSNRLEVNDPGDFNRELVTTFTVGVIARDAANNTGTGTVTVTVIGANDRPIIPEYNHSPNNPNVDNQITTGSVNVLQINENSFNGTIVGQVTAIDQDSGHQSLLTYELKGTVPGFTGGPAAFAIDPFSGRIRVTDSTFLNYEERRGGDGVGNLGEGGLTGFADVVFRLQVRATDPSGSFSRTAHAIGGGTGDSFVYIRLRDVGETAPDVLQSTTSLSLNENSTSGLSVGFFQLVAPLPNSTVTPIRQAIPGRDAFELQQTHSFAIVGGNTNGAFAIDVNSGEVTVANPAAINFETQRAFNLSIQVTDRNAAAVALGAVDNVAPLSTVANLRIDVSDINEVTTIPDSQSFTIPENTVDGTVVGTVIANDPDTQAPNGLAVLRYTIISGNQITIASGVNAGTYTGLFLIDSATGVITVSNQTGLAQNLALDFENQSSFSLTVKVIDRTDEATSANKVVTINLSDVNEIPPSISYGSATIAENRLFGTFVGQVNASTNGDIDQIGSYVIIPSSNPNNAFAIDASGRITVNNPAMIDFETNPVFQLTVQVTDNGTPALFATGTFTVNVSNLNEQIVMLNQNFSVNENTPAGTIVGQITTTDPDDVVGNPQGRTYTINGGDPSGAFSIDNLGRILIANAAAINFEVTTSFSLVVTVMDAGIPATQRGAVMTITVVNVNDAPAIGAQAFNVREHSLAGTVVGTVLATDQDLPTQTKTFSIIGGNTGTAFTINPASGQITVNDPGLIDYATQSIFNLTVQVTDNGTPNLSSSANISIALLDISEPQISSATVALPENSANALVVTNVPVNGGVGPYTWSILSGNTGNAFSINPTTGFISVVDTTVLDLETNQTFALRILVTDSQATPLGDTATITINLTNVNEAPVLAGASNITFTENDAATPINMAITVIDVDSPALASATVTLTTFVAGQDVLGFVNDGATMGNIAINTNAGGVLTLTSAGTTATLAQWQAALRAVTYSNSSELPTTTTRNVTFQVNDGDAAPLNSNTITSTIAVVSVNDITVLTNGSVVNYTENDAATAINTAITVADLDHPTLPSAVVTITNFVAGEDVIGFVNVAGMGNIAIASNVNGVLLLSSAGSTATLAQWQAALRAVTYTNTSELPNTTARNVTFVANDGVANSNTITSTINVATVIDIPTIAGFNPNINYTENGAPLLLDTDVTVTDLDSADFDTGSLRVFLNSAADVDDRLEIRNQGAAAGQIGVSGTDVTFGGTIIGTFAGGSGASALVVTLNTNANAASVQALLRNVTYRNISDNPSAAQRTVRAQLNDGDGGTRTVSKFINFTSVNDVPTITGFDTTITYTENDPPLLLDTDVTVADVDSADFDTGSLTVFLNAAGEAGDRLEIRNQGVAAGEIGVNGGSNVTFGGTLIGTFTGGVGTTPLVITLNANANAAAVEALLRNVTYRSVSEFPSTTQRTVRARLNDGDGGARTVSKFIDVVSVNDTTVLANGSTVNYTENDAATPINTLITVADLDHPSLLSAVVTITNFVAGEDVIGFVNVAGTMGNIAVSTNAGGVLTLTSAGSTATLVEWQTALRAVTYTNTSELPNVTARTVTFVANDGVADSNLITSTINLTTVIDGPMILGFDTTLVYTENGAPLPLDTNVTVTDLDSANFDTGSLRVFLNNAAEAADRLEIRNQGTAAGEIGVNGSNVTFGGTVIGTFTGGSGMTDLVVSLNANSNAAAVQALLRNVTYRNVSEMPSTAQRTVRATLDDGDGGTRTVSKLINVVSVSDNTLLANSATLNYTENDAATAINTQVTVTDLDNTTLPSATVRITNFVAGQDVLGFVNVPGTMGNIAVTGNAGGILTLASAGSTATLAQWQTALQAVTYRNTSELPNTTARNVTFVANDGTNNSNTLVNTINVASVNDVTVLTNGSTITYTENEVAKPINTAITVADLDHLGLRSATIAIANFVAGQDVLGFVNVVGTMGNIAIGGNVNGVLTLTSSGGSATLAQWQTALRAVTYFNTSETPNVTPRNVTFQTNDGVDPSNTIVSTINVVAVNDTLVLSNPSTITYTENDIATPINALITVADSDNATLPSATITMTNFIAGQDVLGFVANPGTMGNIAILSNAGGILRLTSAGSTATVAQWQAALRAVTYFNSSQSPNTAPRNVTFVSTDGTGPSNVLVSTVNVVTVNDITTLANNSAITFTENGAATPINSLITVGDLDNSTLATARITITNFVAGQDVLGFVANAATMGNIAITTNVGGVLTLSSSGSTATVAQWQAALRAVTYRNSSEDPNTATRNVTFVANDGIANSNTVTSTITVVAVNDDPTIVGFDTTITFTENGAPILIDSDATLVVVADVDSANFNGGILQLSLGGTTQNSDQLKIRNQGVGAGQIGLSGANVTFGGVVIGSFSGGVGASPLIVRLNSNSNSASVQALLRNITYQNTSDGPAPGQRRINVSLTDGDGGTRNVSKLLNVVAVNDAPFHITLSTTLVAENLAVGSTVGTFTTSDPDLNETFTYTLVPGDASTDNASFTISGGSLKTAASFDYEVKRSYSIRVRVTDSGGLTYERSFVISVINVNEAPTGLKLSATTVSESSPVGTAVGTFLPTDPDGGVGYSYSLISGFGSVDNASFSIVGNTLRTATTFRFLTKSSYSILVRVTDAGGLFFDRQFTIGITRA